MTDFLQLLISGLATGAIYALAAIGFTLLWQTSQTINFAQGEFVMVPAFMALIAMRWFGVPFVASLVLAILASMLLLGVAFRYIIVGPMERAYYEASGGLAKFDQMVSQGSLTIVHQNPGTVIYAVNLPAAGQ